MFVYKNFIFKILNGLVFRVKKDLFWWVFCCIKIKLKNSTLIYNKCINNDHAYMLLFFMRA